MVRAIGASPVFSRAPVENGGDKLVHGSGGKGIVRLNRLERGRKVS